MKTAVQFMNVISNIPIDLYKTQKQYTLEDLINLMEIFSKWGTGPV
jgi:hypothetical protein